jgi:thymidylate synthase
MPSAPLRFDPLYFGDKLLVINPTGVIGVVTLWSRPEYVRDRFQAAGVDLSPATSPVAVFGTLYGNGLREMLRNLLWNPQIQELWLCGRDLSGSRTELLNFFRYGLEPVAEAAIRYLSEDGQHRHPWRIVGTHRLIDGLVTPEHFSRRPRLVDVGSPEGEGALARIRAAFAAFRRAPAEEVRRPAAVPPLPRVHVDHFPSNPRAHQVVQDTPLEAWLELVYLLKRFGRRVTLAKGERLEVQNVRVVVEQPRKAEPEQLRELNLDPERVESYYRDFLIGEVPPDASYTYGHRLRTYFGVDAPAALAARLAADPEDRKAYFTLWDNRRDLGGHDSRPCLVSVYVRTFEGRLTLTATFRTHNGLDAWLLNFYGLMRLQREVAERAGLPPGAITVFSHSISLDPRELDRALHLAGKRRWRLRLDPMGYFRVTLDGGEILVEHRFGDATLTEYRGTSAVGLQHQIARDLALSDLNHAMYLGRQLARAELALKEGRDFVQD